MQKGEPTNMCIELAYIGLYLECLYAICATQPDCFNERNRTKIVRPGKLHRHTLPNPPLMCLPNWKKMPFGVSRVSFARAKLTGPRET
jgi:hypothetical protein